MAKVDRKKLLNEPDEFLTFSDQAVRWIQANVKIVIIVVAVVSACLAAVIGTKAYLDHREDTAANELAPVMAQYSTLLSQNANPKLLKAAEDSLTSLVSEYGATTAGLQARLALGSLQAEKGKWEKALATFTALCEEENLAPEFKPLAWKGRGQALEGLKKYSEAAEAYADAARLAGPNQKLSLELDQARVLAAAGKKDQAKTIYEQVLAGKPDPQSAATASESLVAMGVAAPGGK